jgi:antitoxin VapB
MALNIKNAQAGELARALAARTGQEPRLRPRLAEELRAISERCAALPDYDKRTPEEIVGFDERGLPV